MLNPPAVASCFASLSGVVHHSEYRSITCSCADQATADGIHSSYVVAVGTPKFHSHRARRDRNGLKYHTQQHPTRPSSLGRPPPFSAISAGGPRLQTCQRSMKSKRDTEPPTRYNDVSMLLRLFLSRLKCRFSSPVDVTGQRHREPEAPGQ